MIRLSDEVRPEAFVEFGRATDSVNKRGVVCEIELELDGAGCEVSINEQGAHFELVGQEAADVGGEGGGANTTFDGQERVEVTAMNIGDRMGRSSPIGALPSRPVRF